MFGLDRFRNYLVLSVDFGALPFVSSHMVALQCPWSFETLHVTSASLRPWILCYLQISVGLSYRRNFDRESEAAAGTTRQETRWHQLVTAATLEMISMPPAAPLPCRLPADLQQWFDCHTAPTRPFLRDTRRRNRSIILPASSSQLHEVEHARHMRLLIPTVILRP